MPRAGPVVAGGSVGDGCALPSAGGSHGAPRHLPAPPRPRPSQRPLLAGAGCAPARSRLPSRPSVRAALRFAYCSAPRTAGACPTQGRSRGLWGAPVFHYADFPASTQRGAAVPVGVLSRVRVSVLRIGVEHPWPTRPVPAEPVF